MNQKPKIVKKDERTRKEENLKSLEVKYMIALMEKYPQKAKEKAKDLRFAVV